MSVFNLIIKEVRHRLLSFLLAALAVFAAVAVSVGLVTTIAAQQRETVRLMRNLGFNLLILPEGADMAQFWRDDYTVAEMPEEYVYRLGQARLVTARHFVARLQQRLDWRGMTILLTGILPELPEGHKQPKSPMGMEIEAGVAYVGYQIAQRLGIAEGDEITFGGTKLTVTRLIPEKGDKDDIRIYAELHDVQRILGKPGIINEIEALGCLCDGKRDLQKLRSEVAAALPGAYAMEMSNIARAREETRWMVDKAAGYIIPAVLVVCGLWVGVLALSNVRQRRAEIGVFRAMGVGTGPVAAVFLGRAVLVGLVGSLLGFGVGSWLALTLGPRLFQHTAKSLSVEWPLLGWSALLATVLCIVAAYIPTLIAITQDPAEVLREE